MLIENTRVEPHSLADEIYGEVLAHPPAVPRPSSTYRIQLNAQFGFDDAQALVSYLKRLGVGDMYVSPCFRAVPGSTHGYDVTDHGELNPELGQTEQFDVLSRSLRQNGMGLMVDVVSNHIGVGTHNPYWMDVLENGPASRYASFFDIDWSPVKDELHNRVLVPTLGDQYGRVLERGELKLSFDDKGFFLRYFDDRFPINVRTYRRILSSRLEQLQDGIRSGDRELQELQHIISTLENMREDGEPGRTPNDGGIDHKIVKHRLVTAWQASLAVRSYVQATLDLFNGEPGKAASFDALDSLISRQPYRLAHWRVAGEEINFRRFFDINSLAAIRVEDPEVFAHVHRLVFQWTDGAMINGLRIDHPDGLYDPASYFERLQEEYVVRCCRQVFVQGYGDSGIAWDIVEALVRSRYRQEASTASAGVLQRPLYVVVEKILAQDERMPVSWAIDGTTGYEFLNALNGIFVDRSRAEAIDDIYTRFVGRRQIFGDLLYRRKKIVMSDSMSSEINMLARRLNRISEMSRCTRDFTLNSLRRALVEYVACFDIYRTYINGDPGGVDARDRHYVQSAISRARQKIRGMDPSIFEFLQDVLLLKSADGAGERERREKVVFVMKLQQLTGAIMAKAMEDTCFYIYNRLISLNEVGGEPARFGNSVWDFHNRNQERAQHWKGALSTTSTHDTKRSEDVRARINVLSEIPEEWKYHLSLWNRIHLRNKIEVNGHLAPDRNEEIFLYQTLLGTWPQTLTLDDTYRERIRSTMQKSLREAKIHTSWLNNNTEYEAAVLTFVDRVLEGPQSFFADIIPFMRHLVQAGMHNSLSQVLLKMASPGVPDIYQGCELWDDSLVDPDNRRPVDFALRLRLLDELERNLEAGSRVEVARDLYHRMTDPLDEGRIKLFLHLQGLRFRRENTELFASGRYIPIEAAGLKREHVCAFARQHGNSLVVAVAPLLVYRMLDEEGRLPASAWSDTWIPLPASGPEERFINIFTGERLETEQNEGRPALRLSQILADFPVALLQRVTAQP